MFDPLLELSHRDNSDKWPNTGFGEEIIEAALIGVDFTCLIWSSANSELSRPRSEMLEMFSLIEI